MTPAALRTVSGEPRLDRVARPIAALPVLSPRLLLPQQKQRSAFPFGDARTTPFYLGRGAVWHAIDQLGLSGEEVLVPAYHHGVEVEALCAAGARPRFYGVKRTFEIDLESLGGRLTAATRAIYVIHYAGFPQPMDDVLAIARTRGLKVIEDCALALFSSHGPVPLGSRSDAAIFCLYKTLPVPHGGALWLARPGRPIHLARSDGLTTIHQLVSSLFFAWETTGHPAAAFLGARARSAARAFRRVHPLPVDSRPVGNRTFLRGQERMGIAPLTLSIVEHVNPTAVVEQRRRNFYALLGRLRDVAPPMVHELSPGVCPLFYPLWCEQKARVRDLLAAAGIETVDFWSAGSPLVSPGEFPDVDALRSHVLELPIHQDLDADQIAALAAAVRRALEIIQAPTTQVPAAS